MSFNPFQFLAGLRRRPSDPEDAVGRVVSLVRRSADIPAFRRSLPALSAEMARARRYQRPLTVLILGLENGRLPEHLYNLVGGNGDDNGTGRQILSRTTQLVSFVLGTILRDTLRESDIATYHATEDRYVLLLTESTRAQARDTVQRLNQLFHRRVHTDLRAGIAEFPIDGLTLDELISSAQQEWHQTPVPVTEIAIVGPSEQDH